MTRLARLRILRGIALTAARRDLANVERQSTQALAVQTRLEGLIDGLPVAATTADRKAIAATRSSLGNAVDRVVERGALLDRQRTAARLLAGQLKVRVEVVDAALVRVTR